VLVAQPLALGHTAGGGGVATGLLVLVVADEAAARRGGRRQCGGILAGRDGIVGSSWPAELRRLLWRIVPCVVAARVVLITTGVATAPVTTADWMAVGLGTLLSLAMLSVTITVLAMIGGLTDRCPVDVTVIDIELACVVERARMAWRAAPAAHSARSLAVLRAATALRTDARQVAGLPPIPDTVGGLACTLDLQTRAVSGCQ